MGTTQAGTITTASILNSDIIGGAGISASKLKHQSVMHADFDQPIGGTPVVYEKTLFMATGPGTIQKCKAWLSDSGTSTDIDFDLEVNGASVLSAQINILHGTGDGTAVSGTVSSGALVAGDIVTALVATVTSSTGAQGPNLQIEVDHDYV